VNRPDRIVGLPPDFGDSERVNSILPPVTGDPHPAARPAYPVALHPYRPWIWAYDPGPGDPFVTCAGPTPVPACPDVARSGRNCLCFDPNGWRSPSYNNLSRQRARTRRRNLLRRGRRGHSSWFLSTAGKRQWRQRQYINTFPHISLLAMDSFYTTDSALFEMAVMIFLYAQKIASASSITQRLNATGYPRT